MLLRSLVSSAPLVLLAALVASPFAHSQPPAASDAPDPVDLVRGLREQGMSDLALEFLHELEKKPGLSNAVKLQLPLERAKCQLEAAIDEPDEGTRISLVGDAKEGFLTFVRNPANASHPRMPEAFLALARLSSMDAKAQLGKARRMDVPTLADDGGNQPAVDEAKKNQKAEARKALPLFTAATNQLKAAIAQIKAQLDKNPEPALKKALTETLYEAEMARGTNFFAMSETYLDPTTAELAERDKQVNEAVAVFTDLIRLEGAPPRVTGVARAWLSECEFAKKNIQQGEEEAKRIEAMSNAEGEEAKRMVRFFKIRRDFLSAIGAPNERPGVENRCREWLRNYGTLRRAQSESFAIRWYLGYLLQIQADALLPAPPKVAPKTPQPPPTIPASARARYEQAEKLYRVISQTDNEYTSRAARQRMYVVRRLLGEADQSPASYRSFEECQMAALIQMARTLDLQKDSEKNADEIKKRYLAIVALLERARELVTPQDNPADVADVNLRLIYYYQVSGQPHLAAILGEHMARTTKAPGGKSALAGALAINGYFGSTAEIKNAGAEKLDSLKKIDRDRSINLATFLDKQFPNDTATDRARHRLAGLLYEDQKPVEAYEVLLKVRPGYESISSARLFQGALASQLLSVKDSPLAKERYKDVFRRTTSDLDKLAKPLPTASEDDVRPYLTARSRLARLYILQSRVDPEGDRLEPGFAKARKVATETLAAVPTFDSLVMDIASKSLNLDGWELRLYAEEAKTAAALAEGTTLFAQGKLDPAYQAIGGILAEMNTTGRFQDQVAAVTKAGAMPAPKKEPEKKESPKGKEPPKKEPEKKEPPKKEPEKKAAPEPKKDADPDGDGMSMDDDPNKLQKDRVVNLARGVDTYRQNLIVLALKIRMKKGEADKSIEQIELLKKFGGSIEANIATLEQITTEMAAQIVGLKRENKVEEAKAMTDGFSKLLARISAEPGLPTSVHRFLGQSLIVVGQYDKAVESLKKVPAPANPASVFKPQEIQDPVEKKAVLEYRRAELELLRAYRLANNFASADNVLAGAMGNAAKPGWAANSLDFRKEKANLFEAKGAATPPGDKERTSQKSWGEALKEWTSLVNIYRSIVQKGPQPGPGGGSAFLNAQNGYYEMFLQHQRCLLKANLHLLPKGDPKVAKNYDDIAKNFVNLEMLNGRTFSTDVRENYHDFIVEHTELKAAYERAVGVALPTADQKAADRTKDAAEARAKAATLRQDATKKNMPVPPEVAQLEERAKMFEEDAAWMKSWKESGGKLFLQLPAQN
jgi:hypothetical protein